MKIPGKSDWSHVYLQETPKEYMLFSAEQEYLVPDYAMRYLLPLFEKLSSDLNRSVNVTDLGSSYGIISTLSLYDLTWKKLIDFYTQSPTLKTDLFQCMKRFYVDHPKRKYQHKPNFYLFDISAQAIEFSKQFDLCSQGYVFDIRSDVLTTEMKTHVSGTDIFLCVGSISYFGVTFFEKTLPMMREKNDPAILAFSTYPLFYYDTCADEIESEFRKYDYEFIRCNKPAKGRRMTLEEYQNFQQGKYQNRSNIGLFENEGYLTSTFYMAVPREKKGLFENWLANVEHYF